MTDREALLAAVIREPLDDTPRLVFADWLDEHGEPEQAEFIRLQIELTKPHPRGLKAPQPNLIGARTREFHRWGKRSGWGKRQESLRRREQELLDGNPTWGRPLAVIFHPDNPLPYVEYGHSGCVNLERGDKILWSWSRGFPSRVTLPDLAAWERRGAEIVRAAPVVEIVVADITPDEFASHPGAWRFFLDDFEGDGGEEQGEKLFDAIAMLNDNPAINTPSGPGTISQRWYFRSRDLALTAAARAFADEARARSGLPPVWSPQTANLGG